MCQAACQIVAIFKGKDDVVITMVSELLGSNEEIPTQRVYNPIKQRLSSLYLVCLDWTWLVVARCDRFERAFVPRANHQTASSVWRCGG